MRSGLGWVCVIGMYHSIKRNFLQLPTRISVKWKAPLDKNVLLPCSSLGKNLLH